jgi:hypothetical protein
VHEHGPAALLDLAEELAVDLAEALDAIAAVEQRDAVRVADRWVPPISSRRTCPGPPQTQDGPTSAGDATSRWWGRQG